MTKGLLLSKNLPIESVESYLRSGTVRSLNGRRSGDTTGYVLEKIGNLMQKSKSYQLSIRDITLEIDCSVAEAERLFKDMRTIIQTLELQHFTIHPNLITYDPWY